MGRKNESAARLVRAMRTREKPLRRVSGHTERAADYDAVVDQVAGKYTAVTLVSYEKSTGLVMRSAVDRVLIGYCVENPLQALKAVFPRYHVTACLGYKFFDSSDFRPTTPLQGLSLGALEPVIGIEGKIKDLLASRSARDARRSIPLEEEEVRRILAFLNRKEPLHHPALNPGYKQSRYEREQIRKVLQRFG